MSTVMQPAGTRRKSDSSPAPAPLRELAERFDPDAIDVSARPTRIRLFVRDEGAWDAVIANGSLRLGAANGQPDALLSADRQAWEQIARDVRGGMHAFRARRLRIRRNLHLGIGFLA